jgi:hypothetical protein
VEGDKYRPYDDTSYTAYNAHNFQISKEEISIKRRMVQGCDVRYFVKALHPIEPSRGQFWAPFTKRVSFLPEIAIFIRILKFSILKTH